MWEKQITIDDSRTKISGFALLDCPGNNEMKSRAKIFESFITELLVTDLLVMMPSGFISATEKVGGETLMGTNDGDPPSDRSEVDWTVVFEGESLSLLTEFNFGDDDIPRGSSRSLRKLAMLLIDGVIAVEKNAVWLWILLFFFMFKFNFINCLSILTLVLENFLTEVCEFIPRTKIDLTVGLVAE
jgi:hypothetical protein